MQESGAEQGPAPRRIRREARLCRAATAGGEFANVVEEDRPLKVVELRYVGRNLGEEGVVHEDGRLVAVARFGIAKQGGDVDLEGSCEAIQR